MVSRRDAFKGLTACDKTVSYYSGILNAAAGVLFLATYYLVLQWKPSQAKLRNTQSWHLDPHEYARA